ncbi:unnamed protein product [Paramecium sonneborni]|uniref:Uncharacterized protein n=1 Tax=Paramecium sonneborni TaxID=65129 RepID=A0A8S1RMC3_9CILI|nr:unnamed protein product [Paramecium sonneborni]
MIDIQSTISVKTQYFSYNQGYTFNLVQIANVSNVQQINFAITAFDDTIKNSCQFYRLNYLLEYLYDFLINIGSQILYQLLEHLRHKLNKQGVIIQIQEQMQQIINIHLMFLIRRLAQISNKILFILIDIQQTRILSLINQLSTLHNLIIILFQENNIYFYKFQQLQHIHVCLVHNQIFIQCYLCLYMEEE